MEKVFVEEFDASFNKHIESVWRDPKILVYILAGDRELARAFAQWLHHTEEHDGAADEDGNVLQYEFEDRDIDLFGHQVDGSAMKVNIRKCMEYLTNKAQAIDILEDPLVKECKKERLMLASSSHSIDLRTGGIHVTVAVGGRVQLSSLLKGASDKPMVNKEIEERGIKLSKALNKYTWKEKVHLLKCNELAILCKLNKHFNSNGTPMTFDDVKAIELLSQEMIAMIPELSDRMAEK
jgi:hypothetical protein